MARSSLSFLKHVSKFTRKPVYYIRVWLPAERRYATAKSAAVLAEAMGLDSLRWPPSTKAGARHIAEAWLAARGGVSRRNNPLLWEYCLAFWDWDRSEYIKGKLERKQPIGKQHCHDSYYRIAEHVKPRIPGLYLRDVTAEDLDRLQLRLKKETALSEKTINMTIAAVITPLKEAYRLGKLPRDPAANFRGLSEDAKKRGIISAAEAAKLFTLPWESEPGRLAALTALSTGARLGEILALTRDDLISDFEGKPALWIRKSWSRYVGIKSTKTGNKKLVPLSAGLRDDLLRLASGNPRTDNFIFWGKKAGEPVTHRIIELGFCRQLRKIGIDETSRLARRVSFHSLRHYTNATLRGKLDDATLRLLMGHADPESTEHYDHLTGARLSEARTAIEKNILAFTGVPENVSDAEGMPKGAAS
ncbi:MAG: site-specific integrase [Spirochaetaceae bacterium]|jgi:integrase|nr:site-specific integrase [Spirochaetaceae bacterium]